LCLGAITATYINIGAYWTYIELASAGSPADPDWVGSVLVWASFMSLVGCLVATVISNRWGLARPLLVTLIAHASVVGMLALGITNTSIFISVFAFNFLWIFIDVYQMSTIATVDHSGRFASLMPAAQGLGQIIGPNIAAGILAAGLGYDAVFIMCALASLTGMLIYFWMYIRLSRAIPDLAHASAHGAAAIAGGTPVLDVDHSAAGP
jgi:predicted MFS family arabinose efflux permease